MNSLNDSPDPAPDLLEIFSRPDGYCSDKWESLLKRYASLFEPLRHQPIRLLEVGVQNGGSLERWAQFFPAATLIAGCDIDPRCASLRFVDPRIHLVIGDAAEPGTRIRLDALSSAYEVIIDDGSHRSTDIVGTFCSLFPALADGGLYVIEDLHCSYWREFDGGLFAPHSAMAFLKRLCDVVNHEHWGFAADPASIFEKPFRERAAGLSSSQLAHVHSVEFANSICIIRKKAPAENVLGPRIIAGTRAPVRPELLTLSGTSLVVPDQTSSGWAQPGHPPATTAREDELSALRKQIHREEAEAVQDALRRLHADNAWLAGELSTMKRQWSWRLTAPFRNLWRFPGRLRRQLRRRLGS